MHGYPLSAYHWRHQMTALADIRRCVAVDLLGLGYTEPAPDARVGYPEQARMLAEVADVLGLDELDLIGNDSGGSISQLLAVSAPGRIRSLTLTNCEVAENNPPAALVPIIEIARAGQLPALFESIVHDVEGVLIGEECTSYSVTWSSLIRRSGRTAAHSSAASYWPISVRR